MQALQYPVERTVIAPVAKTLIHRRPRPKAFRQITLGSTRAQNPKDSVEYQTIITTWATHFLLGRNQILDQFPRCVGEFVTLCHAGLQPIMAAILPQPTFRTKPRRFSESRGSPGLLKSRVTISGPLLKTAELHMQISILISMKFKIICSIFFHNYTYFVSSSEGV